MNRKVVIQLKKLAENYTSADKSYNLGIGLFGPPKSSKRTYIRKKEVIKYRKKPPEDALEEPKIRIGKKYQAEIPIEPDYSSIDRENKLIIY